MVTGYAVLQAILQPHCCSYSPTAKTTVPQPHAHSNSHMNGATATVPQPQCCNHSGAAKSHKNKATAGYTPTHALSATCGRRHAHMHKNTHPLPHTQCCTQPRTHSRMHTIKRIACHKPATAIATLICTQPLRNTPATHSYTLTATAACTPLTVMCVCAAHCQECVCVCVCVCVWVLSVPHCAY